MHCEYTMQMPLFAMTCGNKREAPFFSILVTFRNILIGLLVLYEQDQIQFLNSIVHLSSVFL